MFTNQVGQITPLLTGHVWDVHPFDRMSRHKASWCSNTSVGSLKCSAGAFELCPYVTVDIELAIGQFILPSTWSLPSMYLRMWSQSWFSKCAMSLYRTCDDGAPLRWWCPFETLKFSAIQLHLYLCLYSAIQLRYPSLKSFNQLCDHPPHHLVTWLGRWLLGGWRRRWERWRLRPLPSFLHPPPSLPLRSGLWGRCLLRLRRLPAGYSTVHARTSCNICSCCDHISYSWCPVDSNLILYHWFCKHRYNTSPDATVYKCLYTPCISIVFHIWSSVD